MRLVFVMGGVSSALGKGVCAASLGLTLSSRGLRVRNAKLDPYLNVDPGTLAPAEHGEVWVTYDASTSEIGSGETDLDLGHYERFVGVELPASCSVSSGQVYSAVLAAERRGEYLGHTVQVVPHVTDEIRRRICEVATAEPRPDVCILEVGGTVGDMEIQPFLEAIRQLHAEMGPSRVAAVFLTLVPRVGPSGELKTKPSQHAVAELRRHGISPDVLVARCSAPLSTALRTKLARYCGLPEDRVVSAADATSIYAVPSLLAAEGLDEAVCDVLGIVGSRLDMSAWEEAVAPIVSPPTGAPVRVAIVGKYLDGHDAYLSVVESLRHAAGAAGEALEVVWVPAEALEGPSGTPAVLLAEVDAVVVPGGFGQRGVEGKVAAAAHCRTTGLPYLGLCLGLQVAVVDFARSVAGITDATSAEWGPGTAVVALLEDQHTVVDMGGTMRLGNYPATLVPETRTAACYGTLDVVERHRHRYEVNPNYRQALVTAGLVVSGESPDGALVEFIEIADHPFFVATQAHPEFKSRPGAAHPLFAGLIAAAVAARSAAPSDSSSAPEEPAVVYGADIAARLTAAGATPHDVTAALVAAYDLLVAELATHTS